VVGLPPRIDAGDSTRVDTASGFTVSVAGLELDP
jgi:hypothetical protein